MLHFFGLENWSKCQQQAVRASVSEAWCPGQRRTVKNPVPEIQTVVLLAGSGLGASEKPYARQP